MAVLTPTQIALVRESYALVLRRPCGFAAVFYQRLFHDHPFVRALFPDNVEKQAELLTATLSIVVDTLHDLTPLLPDIGDLARRHVGYGVREHHYPIIGAALIETFAETLDERFTPDMRDAWTAAYEMLAAAMIAAAYPHDQAPDQAGTDSSAG